MPQLRNCRIYFFQVWPRPHRSTIKKRMLYVLKWENGSLAFQMKILGPLSVRGWTTSHNSTDSFLKQFWHGKFLRKHILRGILIYVYIAFYFLVNAICCIQSTSSVPSQQYERTYQKYAVESTVPKVYCSGDINANCLNEINKTWIGFIWECHRLESWNVYLLAVQKDSTISQFMIYSFLFMTMNRNENFDSIGLLKWPFYFHFQWFAADCDQIAIGNCIYWKEFIP